MTIMLLMMMTIRTMMIVKGNNMTANESHPVRCEVELLSISLKVLKEKVFSLKVFKEMVGKEKEGRKLD